MPLITQAGDLATRIARAFGVRGRIPTALDEHIVPVAIMERPDEPPFCDVPSFWTVSARANGLAGTRGIVGVRVVSGVAVVRRVRLVNASANILVLVQLNRQQTTALATTDQIFTLNKQTRANVGPEVPRPAMRLVQADQAAVPGLELDTLTAANTGAPVLAEYDGLCLYENDELLVMGAAVATAFDCHIAGKWYPSLG